MPQDGSNNYQYPPGTPGIPDQTIESEAYNTFLNDLVTNDLNIPRPIHRGGTGQATAVEALNALGGEAASQLVTNFDSHVWSPGSFRATTTATGSPVTSHAFTGWVYSSDQPQSPPLNQNIVVQARDVSDTVVPGRLYLREKKAGVWGSWFGEVRSSASPGPPTSNVSDGTLWWDSETGTLYVYYDDGTSKQWVQATANDAIETSMLLHVAGGTMTGPLTLAGDPTADMHAATKNYVDDAIANIVRGGVVTELLFTRTASQHLTRLFTTTSSAAWTMSMWVKRAGALGAHQALFGVESVGQKVHVGFAPDNSLTLMGGASGTDLIVAGMPPQTNPSLWLNIVWQGAAGAPSVAKFHTVHVNNVGAWAMTAAIGPNGLNAAETHYIGQPGFYPDVIMKDVVFVDGTTVPPTAFGENLGGVWSPKLFAGPFGANGFKLNFADRAAPASANLGKDVSGNSNHWTAVNF